jgi:cupin superfamily acireductone dioxygenase involved in methionine salvage
MVCVGAISIAVLSFPNSSLYSLQSAEADFVCVDAISIAESSPKHNNPNHHYVSQHSTSAPTHPRL